MSEIFKTIAELIQTSGGKPIAYGEQTYAFELRHKVQKAEIEEFERRYNVKIPSVYQEFLLTVGACSLFVDDYFGGYVFLAPHEIYEYSKEVFTGTDCDLFCDILITVSVPSLGVQAGFLTSQKDNNFGEFYPDIPPEYWQEDTDFQEFEHWLKNLLSERKEF